MTFYFRRAGHCTRCEQIFGGNRTTAYMVRETVAWRVHLAEGFALTQREIAPVCDACLTPSEAAKATRESFCEGCGQAMRSAFALKTCSKRCAQRERRARRRRSRLKQPCLLCGVSFTPARGDAKFCSSACKQRSYRQRSASV